MPLQLRTDEGHVTSALQALSSAVQPRALWVAAHHYELAPSMDSGWAHLLQALSTSLGVHDDDARTRRSACDTRPPLSPPWVFC